MAAVNKELVQRWKRLDESWRLAIIVFLAARLLYAVWSWAILTIQPVAIQNFELSSQPIVSVFRLEDSQAHIYLRELNGDILTFQPAGRDMMIDQQTGSIWDVSTGIATQGRYKNAFLSPAKTSASEIFPYHGVKAYPVTWVSMWQRFDANWYVSVAENGYGNIPGDDHFPPFFPLLIRLLTPAFGNSFLAGLFISQLATFYMLKLLSDVFLQWGDTATGKRALLLFAVYPTFFFFFSSYSEPVFLVLALLALRAMRVRSWAWAGFWTFCAIATRLQGAALIPAMLYLMWRDPPFLRKFRHWAGLSVAGMGGLFYLYLRSLQVTSGAVPFVEPEWHARLVPPWETYSYAVQTMLSGRASFIDVLNWAIMTIFILLLIWGWRRIPLEYDLYTAFSILIILVRIVETQPLISMSRYSLTLFPVFFALSLAGTNPWIRRIIIYTSILLHFYLSAQFFVWGWVA